MKRYLVVVERTDTGYSAYSPDLPGCVTTGRSPVEVRRNMQEAIEFHLEGHRLEGLPIPDPTSESAYVEVAA
jgi:predicted RNase H-like HicB family nuclease